MAQAPQTPASPARRSLGGRATASIVAAIVLFIFVIQNRSDVKFKFLVASFTWPLWLYTIIVAVFGAIAWVGLGVVRRRRRRAARREARAE